MKNKEFIVNDVSVASFLKNNGSKMIAMRNGKYVFEYDDTIDANIKLYEETLKKCLF